MCVVLHFCAICSCDVFVFVVGMDRLVRLWNPYVTNEPIGRLRGHSAPICYLSVVGSEKRLYSVSTDRCIKVSLSNIPRSKIKRRWKSYLPILKSILLLISQMISGMCRWRNMLVIGCLGVVGVVANA